VLPKPCGDVEPLSGGVTTFADRTARQRGRPRIVSVSAPTQRVCVRACARAAPASYSAPCVRVCMPADMLTPENFCYSVTHSVGSLVNAKFIRRVSPPHRRLFCVVFFVCCLFFYVHARVTTTTSAIVKTVLFSSIIISLFLTETHSPAILTTTVSVNLSSWSLNAADPAILNATTTTTI